MKIAVIGDVMLDLYPEVSRVKISPESPVIDTTISVPMSDWVAKRGGAANVAANFSSLGCEVRCLGIIGNDLFGQRLKNIENKVSSDFIILDKLLTTTKIRLMNGCHHIHRVSYESNADDIPSEQWASSIIHIADRIPTGAEWNIVLVDYNKGMFKFPQSRWIIEAIGSRPFYVMPKPENVKIFKDSHVLSMNRKEYNESSTSLHVHSETELLDEMRATYLLKTQGEKGLSLYHRSGNSYEVEAMRVEVIDVCGAGDTASAVFFYSLMSEWEIIKSARLANYAGGLVVQKKGCATVTLEQLDEIYENT